MPVDAHGRAVGAGVRVTPSAFTCPRCGATSSHPEDLANRYCGRCHAFTGDPVTDLSALPWRQGRGNGDRAVYAQPGSGPCNDDPPVGVLDTAELAEEVVGEHNAALAARKAQDRARRAGVTRMTGLTGVQIGDGNTQSNVF